MSKIHLKFNTGVVIEGDDHEQVGDAAESYIRSMYSAANYDISMIDLRVDDLLSQFLLLRRFQHLERQFA